MSSTRFDYRTKYRQRAHDEAHADEATPVESDVPSGLAVAKSDAELVTTAPALEQLLAHLREAGTFAYDSEFIGESSYHPRLCLIQVATTERVALIDPLADIDLTPFWELLADASVEKIVHAGAQDVEPVARCCGKPAANVLDTQIGAGFVSMAYPTSLAKLINAFTGIVLHKGLTFTYWDQRPLSAKQLRYAADDVRYLPAAAMELKRRLGEVGHLPWVRAACDALCEPSQYVFSSTTAVDKVRGAGSLDAAKINVLKHLVVWRDACARSENVPARVYLRDEVMIDLCKNAPKRSDQFQRIKGLPRPVIEQEGATILFLIERGMSEPTDGVELLRGREATPGEKFGADVLWTATQAICHAQSIDPAVVTSRQQIGELHQALTFGEPTDTMPILQGWRRQAVGDKLLAMWHGDDAVTVRLAKNK